MASNSFKVKNWYITESLLNDYEWSRSIVNMAYVYRELRDKKLDVSIRSEWIKRELEKL